jgi:hypothetical protein
MELLRFVGAEYYRDIESVLKGLEMALNDVFKICYMIDCQKYNQYGELGR